MKEHYIGLDWAQRNMAIARLTNDSNAEVIDIPSDIRELKYYLKNLDGKVNLTFEESSPAQWLYTELSEVVDRLVVCDPYRNSLLKDGIKTDKTDALKLAKLLRSDMLKPVFHCNDDFIYLRRLISGYEDLIQSGVRLKNQRSALFRANGKTVSKGASLENPYDLFVLRGLEQRIEHYELEKEVYTEEIKGLKKQNILLKHLESVPGIGPVGALTILSVVVDPKRFPDSKTFTSYCGLVKHDIMSGGRSYGKRTPRYNRRLKSVYKIAAISCINAGDINPMKKYYKHLIEIKKYPEYQARHRIARTIASLTYGVLKTKKAYKNQY